VRTSTEWSPATCSRHATSSTPTRSASTRCSVGTTVRIFDITSRDDPRPVSVSQLPLGPREEPDDRYLFHAVVGHNPFDPRNIPSGMVYVLDIRRLLASGNNGLWIGRGDRVTELSVDTGRGGPSMPDLTGPDGPECTSAVLGRLAAGNREPVRSCPADALSAVDTSALRGPRPAISTPAMAGFQAVAR
jgi:hypothetical protein